MLLIGKILITMLAVISLAGMVGSADGFIETDRYPYEYDEVDLFIAEGDIVYNSYRPHDIRVEIYMVLERNYLQDTTGTVYNFTVTDGSRELAFTKYRAYWWSEDTELRMRYYYPVLEYNSTQFFMRFQSTSGIDDTIKFTISDTTDFFPYHTPVWPVEGQAIRENHRIYTAEFADVNSRLDAVEKLIVDLTDRVRALQKLVNTITEVVFR